MKNSNKGLLAALLLLLGSLLAFNVALHAEYARGAYKNPLLNSKALKFSNFTEVEVLAAGSMKVQVVAGPYGVRVDNKAAEFVRISQQGPRLTVALVFPKERQYLGNGNVVTISCPKLNRLTTGTTYLVAGKPTSDVGGRGSGVRVQGFRQDSLELRQDRASFIELANNQLRFLRADVGRAPGSRPELQLGPDNRIQAADLTIGHQGRLGLATAIQHLRQQVSDSATVTFSGAAAHGLGARGAE